MAVYHAKKFTSLGGNIVLFNRKKALAVCMSAALVLQVGSFIKPTMSVSATTVNQFQVSPGVKYKENSEVINSNTQSIKVLEVNVNDPFTRLDLSIPNPINTISTTSTQAKLRHSSTNRVVGAINASFYDTATRYPMYLISQNNRLINTGFIASGFDQYVNKPVAFGLNAQGQALIDYFTLQTTGSYMGVPFAISSMNKVRGNDNLILYTPEFSNGYTNTNQYGYEVVFTGASKNRDIQFGDVIKGTVSEIRTHGTTGNSKIPEDGFVLSAHGTSMATLKPMKVGDQVQVTINIDDKWKNSKYMLASGPMLVNNGKVELGMDPNSSRARERAPRTAVAIDATGSRVFLVTVDGRQAGYSKGMNLTEFAQYLVKLGAYKALNLDGGGSTTMLARKHGNESATLINRPSDGRERAVSTTLQAISTAPLGEPTHLDAKLSTTGDIVVGSSVTVNIQSLVDQYYNPMANDLSQLKISTNMGEVTGNTVKVTKLGKGVITATYGNASETISVNVVKEPSAFTDVPATSEYYSPIKFLTDQKIINGYADGTFRPSTTLKRVDAAILLARALKLDTKNVPNVAFSDVSKDYRFYNEIAAVAGAKIMNGKTETTFDPNAPLTRAEMAVILQRGFKLVGTASVAFTDVPKESFAYDSISVLVANKVTEGFEDGTFRPGGTVNRLQYALFLYRILK